MYAIVYIALLLAQPASEPVEDEMTRAMREAAEAFGGGPSGDPLTDQPRISAVKSDTEVYGYVMDRFTFSWVNLDSQAASSDLPQIMNLLEANVQLRRPLWKNAFASADVSAFFQQGGWFVERDADGRRANARDRDVPMLLPSVVLSELYLSYSPHENVNLLLGKRRIVWGSGFANNPTDLLNPPRDPSDPNLQRTGAIIGKLEVPTEWVTFTMAFAPQVLYSSSGLPYQFLKYPSYPPRQTVLENAAYGMGSGDYSQNRLFPDPRTDSDFHYILAGRVYALVYDSDVNLMYYFSNLYNDSFKNKSRVGLSFSRYFFTDYELHVEMLLTEGTQRFYVNSDCARGLDEAIGCVVAGTPLFAQTKLDSHTLYPRLLVGGRTQLSDESQLSIEYLYVGDGYTHAEFRDFVRGVALARSQGFALGAQGGPQGAIPTRFSFEPLRRHYLFVTYTKPKIKDDFAINVVLLAGLEDLSGILVPTVTWNALEWLNLQLSGFIPIRGIPVGTVEASGKQYSEYSLFPFDVRVFFEARAFY
jgi:hypothetical protein